MSSFVAIAIVVLANMIIFVAAGQVRGGIAPSAWATFYETTGLWQRLVIAGCVYAAIIGPFTLAYARSPAAASLAQAVMGSLMVVALALTVGGKSATSHVTYGCLLLIIVSSYLAWAIMEAPSRT